MLEKIVNFLKSLKLWKKIALGVLLLLVVGVPLAYYLYNRDRAQPLKPSAEVLYLNNEVWTEAERQRYYHLSQGAQIMPYDWLIALE
ncbi:MAG TPA: hypothetical protein VGB76_01530, partial [Pyrinomonadaceae bacterium]